MFATAVIDAYSFTIVVNGVATAVIDAYSTTIAGNRVATADVLLFHTWNKYMRMTESVHSPY